MENQETMKQYNKELPKIKQLTTNPKSIKTSVLNLMGMGNSIIKFRIRRRITPFTFGETLQNHTISKLNKWGFINNS